jgi:hypothetical protein
MFQFNFFIFDLIFQFSNFQFSCLLHDMFHVISCFNYNYNSILFNLIFSDFVFLQQYLSYLRVETANTLFLISTFCRLYSLINISI